VSGIIRATAGNFPLILGLFFYGISFIIYIFALSGSDLSVVYPLVSLSYVWVCLLSVKMLGERMSASKWVAVLLIISGAALVGLGS
jgi:uncharacterized membrane protein